MFLEWIQYAEVVQSLRRHRFGNPVFLPGQPVLLPLGVMCGKAALAAPHELCWQ